MSNVVRLPTSNLRTYVMNRQSNVRARVAKYFSRVRNIKNVLAMVNWMQAFVLFGCSGFLIFADTVIGLGIALLIMVIAYLHERARSTLLKSAICELGNEWQNDVDIKDAANQ
jgi:hypothetical protein